VIGITEDRVQVAATAAAARNLALIAIQPTSSGGILLTFSRHDPIASSVETGPFALEMATEYITASELARRDFADLAAKAAERAAGRLYMHAEKMNFLRPMGAVS